MEGTITDHAAPTVAEIFVRTLKAVDPTLLVSICVFGDPDGHNLDNFLINLMVANSSLIDWCAPFIFLILGAEKAIQFA
jgi:hypothetical protein